MMVREIENDMLQLTLQCYGDRNRFTHSLTNWRVSYVKRKDGIGSCVHQGYILKAMDASALQVMDKK